METNPIGTLSMVPWLGPALLLVVHWLPASPLSAAELPGGKRFTNSLDMDFVLIEAGEFAMGTGEQPPKSRGEWEEREWDEVPAHRVKISRAFFMSTCEVTNSQFEQFDPEHRKLRGLSLAGSRTTTADDEPVTAVSWHEATEFCRWLSRKEGRTYRLPSEAEWEYACRAKSDTRFCFGDDESGLGDYAWFAANADRKAHPVTRKKPNAWGLFDVHGNVGEWCLDWHGPYESARQTDPAGRADGYAKVTRGGDFSLIGKYCRSSNRGGCLPDDARNPRIGFRVVLSNHTPTNTLPAAPPAIFTRDVQQKAPIHKAPSDEPYYDGFENRRPTIPPDSWGPLYSHHNHNTGIAACPNGDVLFTWKMMVNEGGPENAVAISRLRQGPAVPAAQRREVEPRSEIGGVDRRLRRGGHVDVAGLSRRPGRPRQRRFRGPPIHAIDLHRREQRAVVVRSAVCREERHPAVELRTPRLLPAVLRHRAGRDRHASCLTVVRTSRPDHLRFQGRPASPQSGPSARVPFTGRIVA